MRRREEKEGFSSTGSPPPLEASPPHIQPFTQSQTYNVPRKMQTYAPANDDFHVVSFAKRLELPITCTLLNRFLFDWYPILYFLLVLN